MYVQYDAFSLYDSHMLVILQSNNGLKRATRHLSQFVDSSLRTSTTIIPLSQVPRYVPWAAYVGNNDG